MLHEQWENNDGTKILNKCLSWRPSRADPNNKSTKYSENDRFLIPIKRSVGNDRLEIHTYLHTNIYVYVI